MSLAREKLPQLGFWDADVSKPKHDDICTWVLDNADVVLSLVHPEEVSRSWRGNDISWGGFRAWDPRVKDSVEAFMASTARPAARVVAKRLEYVLQRESGRNSTQIVGYADVLLGVDIPRILVSQGEHPGQAVTVELEWQRARWLSMLVEAKTTMPSLGELMRQLNLYRTAFSDRAIVVVSPDDRHASRLKEQDVHFIRYDPDDNIAGPKRP